MCELLRQQDSKGTSLGAFRPAAVEDFTIEQDSADWDPDKAAIVDQPSLLLPTKQGLEKIPYRFRYHYTCTDSGCRGHHQSIIDWELAESYRSWRDRYPDEEQLLAKFRERWLGEMCREDKDTLFFVGNQRAYPEGFLVLGVFWPPKT
jgi:hypothetical protein